MLSFNTLVLISFLWILYGVFRMSLNLGRTILISHQLNLMDDPDPGAMGYFYDATADQIGMLAWVFLACMLMMICHYAMNSGAIGIVGSTAYKILFALILTILFDNKRRYLRIIREKIKYEIPTH